MAWIAKPGPLTQEEMENNAIEVNNFYSALGYDINTIAGMLGNFQNESTINPERDAEGIAYGLVMWTPPTWLYDACDKLGIGPYTDGNVQCEVVDAQLTDKAGLNTWYTTPAFIAPYYNSGATGDMIGITGEQFCKNPMGWDPGKLAVMFMVGFERPDYDPEVNHWTRRVADAGAWYQFLTGHPPTPTRKFSKLPLWGYLKPF